MPQPPTATSDADADADAPAAAAPDAAPPGAGAEGDAEPANGGGSEELDLEAPIRIGRAQPRPIGATSATLTWRKKTIRRFPVTPALTGGGLYLVVTGPDRVPLYVGEADNFADRFRKRLREAYQVGAIDNDLGGKVIEVWFADLPGASETVRKTIEWALVRALKYGGVGAKLRNASSIHPFRPTARITIQLALPNGIHRRLTLPNPAQTPADVLTSIRGLKASNTLTIDANMAFELELDLGQTESELSRC